MHEWYSNIIFTVFAKIKFKKTCSQLSNYGFSLWDPFIWMKMYLNFKNFKLVCIYINFTMYSFDFSFIICLNSVQKKQLLFKFLKPITVFQSWIFVYDIASNLNIISRYKDLMDEKENDLYITLNFKMPLWWLSYGLLTA